MPAVDYLAIGHITLDRLRGGLLVGGSVSYAATAAVRLGLAAGVVTSAGTEQDWASLLPGVEIVRCPASATTSFENLYQSGRRLQRLLASAEPVGAEAVPAVWRQSPIVHLAPVVHELGRDLATLFPGSLVGLTPQGLLRHWDASGLVRQGRWAGDDVLLSACTVVVLSEDDLVGDPDFLSRCIGRIPVVAVTRGAEGATLYVRGRPTEVAAFPATEVDPTGAGDVFAAALLIELHRTEDPYHSAAFASCAASFVVEGLGLRGVPDRASVEARLELYRRER